MFGKSWPAPGLSPHKFSGDFPLKPLIIFHDSVGHNPRDPKQHRRGSRRVLADKQLERVGAKSKQAGFDLGDYISRSWALGEHCHVSEKLPGRNASEVLLFASDNNASSN